MQTFYTKDHEWIKVENKTGTIGISTFAAEQLGDITYVELPSIGKTLKMKEVLCGIESVKAASDIYAPVSGKVIEVNENLENTPEVINQSAEGEGWIAKIEIASLDELKNLMNPDQYKKYLEDLNS
ncbi:MAG TPA: glycine cleavage system protein GcvH [Spirochaetia bacterium]|nr:MAG: glycine cleavage system protein H [Spirochaetes bacterium GWB1_36_13]HCL56568.1 glycine cleavage system protein GcvH [Spirochaetia bacterium]